MSSILKGDIINLAYSKGRISGLTAQPTPEDINLALVELEGMLAQYHRKTICLGYKFEDDPDVNAPSGLTVDVRSPVAASLAVVLLNHFGKVPSPELKAEQMGGFSYLSSVTSQVKPIRPPSRQPIGSGNSRFFEQWNRYYQTQAEAPISCDVNKMAIGDIQDFVEHFDAYLTTGEDITSHTLEAETGLAITTQSLESPDINYRVRADGTNNETDTNVLQVKIVATTTTGRITTRRIIFELTKVEIQ
jgi:hypothetical protein